MDKVIVTGLLIVGAVAAAVVVIMTIGPSISGSSQSVVEANRATADKIKTNIEIIGIGVDSVGEQVDAWVKNVGVAPVDAIEKSDLFLIQPGTRFEALPYSGDPPSSNYWYSDLKENSQSWLRGDTMHVTVQLSTADNILVDTLYTLRVSTPNGVTAEKSFSR